VKYSKPDCQNNIVYNAIVHAMNGHPMKKGNKMWRLNAYQQQQKQQQGASKSLMDITIVTLY